MRWKKIAQTFSVCVCVLRYICLHAYDPKSLYHWPSHLIWLLAFGLLHILQSCIVQILIIPIHRYDSKSLCYSQSNHIKLLALELHISRPYAYCIYAIIFIHMFNLNYLYNPQSHLIKLLSHELLFIPRPCAYWTFKHMHTYYLKSLHNSHSHLIKLFAFELLLIPCPNNFLHRLLYIYISMILKLCITQNLTLSSCSRLSCCSSHAPPRSQYSFTDMPAHIIQKWITRWSSNHG